MAVPKRKTSPARRGLRRSHHALNCIKLHKCPQCSELKRPYYACMKCNTYKGNELVVMKEKK